MGSCDAGMFDVKEEKCSVRIGDGKMLTGTKVGKKRVTVVQKDGTMTDIVLSSFEHVPGPWVNLFSLLLPLTTGWLISNVGPVLAPKKDDTAISFDGIFATKDGFLGGVDMIAKEEIANLCLQSKLMTSTFCTNCLVIVHKKQLQTLPNVVTCKSNPGLHWSLVPCAKLPMLCKLTQSWHGLSTSHRKD